MFLLLILLFRLEELAAFLPMHVGGTAVRPVLFQRNAVETENDVWDGKGMSQSELMNKDECVLVDSSDTIIGHDSKYNAHRFTVQNPAGLLHRAFSVFLFSEDGKLLLQQRASNKITFPSVWTNTCCSHQLYGYSPSEVDDASSIAKGEVLGTKAAAIRKL